MSLSLHSWPVLSDAMSTFRQWRTTLQAMKLATHLRDVDFTNLADNDLIQYNALNMLWENQSFVNALPADAVAALLSKLFSNAIKSDWSPTLVPAGSLTLSSVVQDYGYYLSIGNWTHLIGRWSFTTATATAAYISVPLPINTSGPDYQAFPFYGVNGGNPDTGAGLIRSGEDAVRAYGPQAVHWSLGTNRQIILNGGYLTSAP